MHTAFSEETKTQTQPEHVAQTYVLDNGLTLIVKPDTRAPVVLAQIWYKVGSVYEPNGITGISHMLEHMMFKGTHQLEPGQIEELVEENGGSQNAFTSYDFTAYYQFWGSDNLDLSFKIESSRMSDLVLDQDLFDKEKQVVMEERRMRTEDNPIAFAQERFLAATHVANPRHHPVIGWMSDIEQYQLNDLKKWYQKWYAPNNAIIVVIGDVEPSEVHKKAEQYFSHIKPVKLPEVKKHPEISASGYKNVEVHHPNVQVPTLFLGFNSPGVHSTDSDDIYPLIILENILGGSDSARLQQELVRGSEIATGISTHYDPFALDDVTFTLLALPDSKTSLKVLQAKIEEQIQDIIENGIEDDELQRVKTNILASKIYMMDSLTSQAMIFGSYASLGLPSNFSDTVLEKLQSVSKEDVQRVAQKYLKPNNLTSTYLVSEEQSEKTSTASQTSTPKRNKP